MSKFSDAPATEDPAPAISAAKNSSNSVVQTVVTEAKEAALFCEAIANIGHSSTSNTNATFSPKTVNRDEALAVRGKMAKMSLLTYR